MRGECIEHTQTGNARGYGTVTVNGVTRYAHRVSFANSIGVSERDLRGVVMHLCDNPRCINPNHLAIGTHADNSADMVSKGRSHKPAGELNPMVRLSQAKVDFIRRTHVPRSKDCGARALARLFNVSEATVRDILKQRTWKES